MSLQVFLYAQFRGIEPFVCSASDAASFADRSLWVSQLTESTPKEFLEARGLSPLLVGYAAGGTFLLLLPETMIAEADSHLASLRDTVESATGGALTLYWSSTENLGSWPHVWKRLRDGILQKRLAPLAHRGAEAFDAPMPAAAVGPHPWDGLAPREVTPQDLGRKARGRRAWGLLCCEIDLASARLDLADSAENFQFLALLYKGLVAGELQRIANMPAHEGRVAILYSGGHDFAVTGAWDALLSVAAEFHRVFTLFSADLPGGKELAEGVSLSAALAVARSGESLPAVWKRNRESLESVRASGRNALALFGRILDWPALKDAEGLKARIRKLRDVYHCPAEVFEELEDFYGVRGAGDQLASPRSRRRERSVDRPWRFHSRLRRLAGDRTGSEFERQWRAFLGDLIGRGQVQKQLRPAGKVALDWARLEGGSRGQE
ncbi:MAG TPA: hypothetical protein VFQ91_21610 [Bryobacteraceae bacterium]|nr:hypothetical protein [Bryobacteraceae bacterium]